MEHPELCLVAGLALGRIASVAFVFKADSPVTVRRLDQHVVPVLFEDGEVAPLAPAAGFQALFLAGKVMTAVVLKLEVTSVAFHGKECVRPTASVGVDLACHIACVIEVCELTSA